MKLKGFLAISISVICLLSVFVLKPNKETPEINTPAVSTVTLNLSDSDSSKILASRFLNMLNHNFVYGEDFLSADSILSLSITANCDKAEFDGEFIKEDIVTSFVFDMYGIEIVDTKDFSAKFPEKEGFLYLSSKGYTVYNHKNAKITENEDGTYTVITEVSVDGHDGEKEILSAKTLFVKNSESVFGFNIIYSEISDTAQGSLQM